MTDLFAGFPVSDFEASVAWYRDVLGAEPAFYPNEREAVWQTGEHSYVYIEVLPDRAGGSLAMVMADDIDATISGIADRGVRPARIETYEAGMVKAVYADPDGNEFSFGGVAAAS